MRREASHSPSDSDLETAFEAPGGSGLLVLQQQVPQNAPLLVSKVAASCARSRCSQHMETRLIQKVSRRAEAAS